jgi:glycerol-3-phosphate dehydrogenase (NAD(P)+)
VARIVILGAGVMGSAMAVPAAAMGHDIELVGTHLDEAIIGSIQGNGLHPRLNVQMPEKLRAHQYAAFDGICAEGADLIILGVSSAGVGWAIERLIKALKKPVPILMITKGLQDREGEIQILPDVVQISLKEALGFDVPVMAVGGPCIAGELAAERDTSVTITGRDASLIEQTIGMLGSSFYHARASDDVIGVELCAAFKNFFALAVGWAQGRLEISEAVANSAKMHNLASGIFTQAVRELGILVESLGGSQSSVAGLAGVGDLYVTCLAGRNSRMGRLLGLGLSYSEAKAKHMADDTVEGAELAKAMGPALRNLWQSGRLPAQRMPLSRAVVDAICDDKPLVMQWQEFAR